MLLLEIFSAPSSLYVNRPLIVTDEFTAWVKQYFKRSLDDDEFHVTIAHSKVPFDWTKIEPDTSQLTIFDGPRSIVALGEKGAVVLKFESEALQKRWKRFCKAGASWDFPEYQPHVTITYAGGNLDLEKIVPFDGVLKFGAEEFAPVIDYKPDETYLVVRRRYRQHPTWAKTADWLVQRHYRPNNALRSPERLL
jgi:hypothetical protein